MSKLKIVLKLLSGVEYGTKNIALATYCGKKLDVVSLSLSEVSYETVLYVDSVIVVLLKVYSL